MFVADAAGAYDQGLSTQGVVRRMNTDTDESQQLLELAAHGDRDSWGVLLTLHEDRLFRLVTFRLDRRLQGRVDVADVLQEIYLAAWRNLTEYVQGSPLPFYLWLRGIACNKLLELHRHHLGVKMRDARRECANQSPSTADTTSAAISSLLMDDNTSPSGVAVRAEIRLRLERAIDGMNPIDREVLALRHFEQLNPAETAQVLMIEEKAAGMRYLRALKRLREILEQQPGGLESFRL